MPLSIQVVPILLQSCRRLELIEEVNTFTALKILNSWCRIIQIVVKNKTLRTGKKKKNDQQVFEDGIYIVYIITWWSL